MNVNLQVHIKLVLELSLSQQTLDKGPSVYCHIHRQATNNNQALLLPIFPNYANNRIE